MFGRKEMRAFRLPPTGPRDKGSFDNTIPILYPNSYDTLLEISRKGEVLSTPCQRCSGILQITQSSVDRGAVLTDEAGLLVYHHLKIPLALCRSCRARIRVLPVELLPYKTYGFLVIEMLCSQYLPAGPGLRPVVDRVKGEAPAHSTLWRWLDGLGERVLDLTPPQDSSLPRTAALVEESACRLDPKLYQKWQEPLNVVPEKYKSEGRLERLCACLRLLLAAAFLFEAKNDPLRCWQQFLIGVFHVPAWSFSTRRNNTGMQRDFGGDLHIDSHPTDKNARAPP